MEHLREGQQFMLGTRRGMLNVRAIYDGEAGTWTFCDKGGEPIFQLGSTGQLIPMRDLGDRRNYTIRDLHEWATTV